MPMIRILRLKQFLMETGISYALTENFLADRLMQRQLESRQLVELEPILLLEVLLLFSFALNAVLFYLLHALVYQLEASASVP